MIQFSPSEDLSKTEEIIMKNGVEFSDWIAKNEVPGSKEVEGLVRARHGVEPDELSRGVRDHRALLAQPDLGREEEPPAVRVRGGGRHVERGRSQVGARAASTRVACDRPG